jgi:hypothetical protein
MSIKSWDVVVIIDIQDPTYDSSTMQKQCLFKTELRNVCLLHPQKEDTEFLVNQSEWSSQKVLIQFSSKRTNFY